MAQEQAFPSFMIFSDLPIREDVRARIMEELNRFLRGEVSALLLEPGFSVYQAVDGKWEFLWGEPRSTVTVEPDATSLGDILEVLRDLTAKLHTDIPKAFAEANW